MEISLLLWLIGILPAYLLCYKIVDKHSRLTHPILYTVDDHGVVTEKFVKRLVLSDKIFSFVCAAVWPIGLPVIIVLSGGSILLTKIRSKK